MCLSFFLSELTKLCGSSSPPRVGGHVTPRTVLCGCVFTRIRACVSACLYTQSPSAPAAASYHVYSPITSTVAELQLANLQCSQRSQKGPLRLFDVPPVRLVRRPDREVLCFTYLMCADVICALTSNPETRSPFHCG